jgi:hypothetical protein
MTDPYKEYDLSTNETVPAVTGRPTSAPVHKSMGAVEIGVIAVAIAVTIIIMSAVVSLSRRR